MNITVKQIGFLDDKYINLVSEYQKHINCINTITEILPISFLFHLCIALSWLFYVNIFNSNGYYFKYLILN